MPKEIAIEVGTFFGLWTTTGPRKGRFVPVRCICGHRSSVLVSNLRSGASRRCITCGHLAIGLANTKHGDSRASLYGVWQGMRRRCSDPARKDYRIYGGRGISVCADWEDSYERFRKWALAAGYQKSLTIDRIDPDGNYEPSNCRWITRSDNSRRARRGVRK